MKYTLDKITELVRQTGKSFIVIDSKQDTAFVILPVEEFERSLRDSQNVRHLTEEELLDKINRDIAVWRSNQEAAEFNDWELDNLSSESVADLQNKVSEEKSDIFAAPESVPAKEKYYFEPIE